MHRFAKALVGVIALLAILGASGCAPPDKIEASGSSATETRDVGDVQSVQLDGPGVVTLSQVKGSSVVVTADKAAMPYVTTDVVDGVLTIAVERGGRSIPVEDDVKIAVAVRSPEFVAVKNTSGGTIRSKGIAVDAFQIGSHGTGTVEIERITALRLGCDLAGAGDVRVGGGAVGAQQVNVSGSGSYIAPDLKSQVALLTVGGSGHVEVWVTETLKASVTGTGFVSYWGEPVVTAESAASGSLMSLGPKTSE